MASGLLTAGPETRPKISAVFSRTPARPFSFRAGAARLRILSYETVEAEHRRTTPFVVYSGIVFLLFLPQPSFARLFVFAPASRAVCCAMESGKSELLDEIGRASCRER